MNIRQVAAQLYTVRTLCQTPADTARTLRAIKEIGYPAVQISGICAMPDAELATMLRDTGLICCATHESSDAILGAPARVADHVLTLGARLVAYPYPANVPLKTPEDVKAFAARLEAAGRIMNAAGVMLCYHNHHMEFRRIGGRPILESLYAETDPRYLQGEPDTYWIQYGGGDPVDWCRRLKDRMPIIHMKDYAVNAEHQPVFAEIGNGNLPWARIVEAADAAGCQWFCVEQDTCPGNPLDSLRASFAYIRGALCRV